MMEFLEDVIAAHNIHSQSPLSALDINQAWSRLRAPNPSPHSVQMTLQLLQGTGKKALHIGESQVSLLLTLSKLQDSQLEILGNIRSSAAVIISIWVRRSCLRWRPGNSTSTLLKNVAETFIELLQEEPEASNLYVCPAILLLGAVSASPLCDKKIVELCQTALVEELTIRKRLIVTGSWLPEVLAGAGYALTAARGSMITSLTGCLISLWTLPPFGEELQREYPPLSSCSSVLRLFEFVGSWLSVESVVDDIAGVLLTGGENIVAAPSEVKNIKVMAAAGLIRGARRVERLQAVKVGMGSLIKDVATELLRQHDDLELVLFQGRIEELESFVFSDASLLHQLRCISLAVTSCSSDLQGHPSLMSCLVISLLGDVLGLSHVYCEETPVESVVDRLKSQVEGALFREAGALARAVCEQYRAVSSVLQEQFESLFWRYAVHSYNKQRMFLQATRSQVSPAAKLQVNEHLNKVLEAVFQSVVLFYYIAMKEKLAAEDSRQLKLAVTILDAYSRLEYVRVRRQQLPEHVVTVKGAMKLVSNSREASLELVNMLPSYQELISFPGKPDYSWSSDEVQTNRVYFFLRLFVPCLSQLDDTTFESQIAPIIFLYMCHPTKEVSIACHHLFTAFVFHRGDVLNVDGETSLAEQLGVYYITRAVEGYPEYTPVEGLVEGVAAIGRYLPAGSVTVRHCIDLLVKKAEALFSQKHDDEAAERIQILLLQLLFVVDIQTLPFLLKQVATLILKLPRPTRQVAVEQAFGVIAGSEDHVRKTTLVAWLQSLTFISKM